MQIRITFDGTAQQIKTFLRGGFVVSDLPTTFEQSGERASRVMEDAVRVGHTQINLDTRLEVREIGGCLVKGKAQELDEIEEAVAQH